MPEVCDSPQRFATSVSQHPRGRRRGHCPRLLIVALLIAGAAGGAWFGGLKYCVLPKRFAAVEPGRIYRSGQISRWLIGDVLDRHEIGLIIDLNGKDPADEDQSAELAAARRRGIPVQRFPLRGNGTGKIQRYADALTALHRAAQSGKPVLIHCHAGGSRTGAAVAFYRLLVQRWRPEDVRAEMEQFGRRLSTDYVLVVYMNAHMRDLAVRLVQSGVIDRVPPRMPQLCQ